MIVGHSGARLNIVSSGSGPVVLFIHGVGCNATMWSQVMRNLDSVCRSIAVDLPGYGSSPAQDLASIDDWVRAISPVLDVVDHEDLYVVGHSFGGMVAQVLVANNADRVQGLALCDTSSGGDHAPGRMQLLVELVEDQGPHVWATSSAAGLWGPPNSNNQAAIDWLIEELSRSDPRALVGGFKAVDTFSFTTRLTELKMRSLVLAGEYDLMLPASRRLAEGLPNAVLEVMPDLGHMAPFEDPRQFAEILTNCFELP